MSLPRVGTMTAMVRRRVIVHGDVQGVFFRDTARQKAQDARVAGWVRNRGDGAVEAVFEGDDERVQTVVAFMKVGPEHAKVVNVEIVDEEPQGLDGFDVR
jgi:acylphosphatase